MALFSDGGTTFPDVLVGVLYVLLATIATPLNILVLLDNIRKPSSIARSLYLALGASDLASSLLLLGYGSVSFFQPYPRDDEEVFRMCNGILSYVKVDPAHCADPDNHLYVRAIGRPSTWIQNVIGVVSWGLVFAPCILTGLLATTRYIKIKYPLKHLNHRLVVTLAGLGCSYSPTALTIVFSKEGTDYSPMYNNVWVVPNEGGADLPNYE